MRGIHWMSVRISRPPIPPSLSPAIVAIIICPSVYEAHDARGCSLDVFYAVRSLRPPMPEWHPQWLAR